MFQVQGLYLNAMVLCGKWHKELEGITICFDSVLTYPLNVGQVLIEEPVNA
jgi:hypothetical protein